MTLLPKETYLSLKELRNASKGEITPKLLVTEPLKQTQEDSPCLLETPENKRTNSVRFSVSHPGLHHQDHYRRISKTVATISRHYQLIKTLSHIFWIIFCVVGLAYHLQTICDSYFKYSITTETTIKVAVTFSPPALTACFDAVQIIRPGFFDSNSDCYEDKRNPSKTTYRKLRENLANCARQLFRSPMFEINNMTYDFEDLFTSVWFRDIENYMVHKISQNQSDDAGEFQLFLTKHVKTAFKGYMKCFSIRVLTESDDKKLTYNTYTISDMENEGIFVKLGIKENPVSEFLLERNAYPNLIPDLMTVYAHENSSHPREYLSPSQTVNVSHFKSVVLTYQEVENILLPPPFPSACRDYSLQKEYKNQKQCIEECLDKEIRPEPDGLLSPSTVKDPLDVRRVRGFEDLRHRKFCVERCPLSCRRKEYFVHVAVAEEQGERTVGLASGEPVTTVTFKPRTETFEFVIFVSSCFNLWFGVSFYLSTIDICHKLSHRFIENPEGSGIRETLLYFHPNQLLKKSRGILRFRSAVNKIRAKISSKEQRRGQQEMVIS